MGSKILVWIFLGILFVNLKSVSSQRQEAVLDPDGKFVAGWVVDTARSIITFDVAVETKGYFALGISDTGNMQDLDAWIGMVLDDTSATIEDYYADGNFRPNQDPSQDVHLLYGYESETHTYMRFSRALDTGDEYDDNPITNSSTYLVWAIGETDNFNYHGGTRGNYAVNLLQPSGL